MVLPLTEECDQPLGELVAEHEVNAGIRAAVQTRQQHQDGESRSWEKQGQCKQVSWMELGSVRNYALLR